MFFRLLSSAWEAWDLSGATVEVGASELSLEAEGTGELGHGASWPELGETGGRSWAKLWHWAPLPLKCKLSTL